MATAFPKPPGVPAAKTAKLLSPKPPKLPGAGADMPKMQGNVKPYKPPRVPGIHGSFARKLGNHYENT